MPMDFEIPKKISDGVIFLEPCVVAQGSNFYGLCSRGHITGHRLSRVEVIFWKLTEMAQRSPDGQKTSCCGLSWSANRIVRWQHGKQNLKNRLKTNEPMRWREMMTSTPNDDDVIITSSYVLVIQCVSTVIQVLKYDWLWLSKTLEGSQISKQKNV